MAVNSVHLQYGAALNVVVSALLKCVSRVKVKGKGEGEGLKGEGGG